MKVPEPRKLKSGTWFIQLRLGGESIPVSAATSKECKRQAELIKAEYRSGKRIEAQQKTNKTVGEAVDAYIEKLRPVLSPSTIRGYRTIRKNRFQGIMSQHPEKVKEWQAVINLESERCSSKTLKNSWQLICTALKNADYPVPQVVLPRVIPKTRPWMDSDEIKRFIAAVHGTNVEIPALLGLLGLRRSEIMGVTWDRVDLDKRMIRVEGAVVSNDEGKFIYKETNKQNASRRIVPIMIPELVTALSGIPEEKREGPVVTMHPNSIYRAINTICEQERLPLVGVHGLRHSFASLGHHVGVPEAEMQRLGGWSDAGTMHKIYEHIEAADHLKAENAMTSFYKNANENAN